MKKTGLYLGNAEIQMRLPGLRQCLKAEGIQSGQRVALLGPPSPFYGLLFWGLWSLGAITCPLNPAFPAILRQGLSADCDRVISVQPEGLSLERWLDWNALAESVSDSSEGLSALPWQTLNPEQPICQILTSGSSGAPKAALHSWGNYRSSAEGSAHVFPLGVEDRWLVALPLFHVGGLAILVRTALAGATAVFPEPGQSLAEALQSLKPTHLSLVPTQLYRLLDQPLAHESLRACRAILLGGSAIPSALIQRGVDLGLKLYTSYGSTEMSSQICTTAAGASFEELQTSGRLLPGRELSFSPQGELLVRGLTRFLGYWKEGDLEQPFDTEGWFATGDLGEFTSEGWLRVLGRKDHRFISGGENIQPEVIERVLLTYEGVYQALVVPLADPEFGQRPVAILEADPWPERWALRNFLKQFLPGFMLPDHFLPWPQVAERGLKPNRQNFQAYAQKILAQG
ncbi:o-succinylbenzoate--CoA ligase [bacterium (Candidatus Blackallbacteria) CG17_big_fil_post_rev_8_21_14_2_50_48_46]|uniref:O-succinylbenzoate--CoA ligase n=1 Tax=bacterium (Candidatus Blackallbacteria) CG17_big_fil_post_rev_8_21_14_2_50_48_46 TaxID=2014261 RepID=A0A2M7G0Q0_9BACT|nr:MAG: o-succinylbenzoate--CoA ligase [bacterium (Candidatus Blackallbacteria) CG18_big_fil_WC_8_21_14_2_50_49_26]PIW15206.1 MAG: o-succinylbenzoate--CoA ligase [bacterium (Candidatus Blackallbacteria) CG17_big_fil_post_rev_8_21_14_2_50_48_46]PIW44793.1 MAG: o-succinylbenzoate--CoA ligase [bacterium (Candidatus Blackallbacteria) CG13_big_fil_rev_8_21_14_2_50_49_14]